MGSSTHGAGESSAVPLTIRALGLAGHGRRLNLELTLPHFRRTLRRMAKKSAGQSESPERGSPSRSTSEISIVTRKSPRARSGEAAAGQETRAPDGGRLQRPSALLDTRVVYCGDNLEQLAKLPDACVDLIYIDPPFNSNRNYEVFWGESKEKRAFEDRHENTGHTLTTCARAACNSPASSKRPAAFIATATGTPATTSRSCSTRFLGRIKITK